MIGSEVDDELVQVLLAGRKSQCFPGRLRGLAADIADRLLALLFPHFSPAQHCDEAHLRAELLEVRSRLEEFLDALARSYPNVDASVLDEFERSLPAIHRTLLEDAAAIEAGDPAATSVDEVILAYPGFFATAVYRVAYALNRAGFPLLPRLLGECAHGRTGIDIHPGAEIGHSFVIDHGTGVVIGETASIGNRVKIYQGVTLGALTVDKQLVAKKRHPTIGDDVVIYANATILGGGTVVGRGSIVGGNVWLTRSVPPGSVVTHQADVRVRAPGEELPLDYQI